MSNTMTTLQFSCSDECKAVVKSAAKRTYGTLQRAFEQTNAAIAENVCGQASFARLQTNVAREV